VGVPLTENVFMSSKHYCRSCGTTVGSDDEYVKINELEFCIYCKHAYETNSKPECVWVKKALER